MLSGFFYHEIRGERRVHEAGRLTLIRDTDFHALRGSAFSYINLAFPPWWMDRLGTFLGRPSLRGDLESALSVPGGVVPVGDRQCVEAHFATLLQNPGAVELFATLLPLLVSYLEVGDRPGSGRSRSVDAVDRSFLAGEGLQESAPGETPRWLADLATWAASRQRPPPLATLVRKSGYSAEHVSRSFGAHYGVTPSRFLAELRLRQAETLLRFTNYSVARIAEESGWESVRHFERRFREWTGRSPREYRKEKAILAH